MRVAYIMSRFPKLTETFVLFEMAALERHGFEVALFPLLRENTRLMHDQARPWMSRAHFLPFLSWPILWAQWYYLRRRSFAYLRLWWEVLSGAWGSLNFFLGALGILPKAVRFAYEMSLLNVQHVHAHFANHPAVAALAIHRLTGIPYSFTAHGSDLHKDRHMLCRKVKQAAFVVTVSRYNQEVIVRECGEAARSKVRVIHSGVETDVFRPSNEAARDRPYTILCVGTLHEVKGQSYLIEACRKLHQRGIDFVCHFVGDGPDRRRLERQCAKAGLEDRIVLHGQKTRDELIQILAGADVLVAASVPTRGGKREGLPVVLIEALACAVPVVASALSGIPELVEPERTGLLVPVRDSESLADALQRLHDEPDLRRRLGSAGRERVMSEFDLDQTVMALGKLMLSSGGAA